MDMKQVSILAVLFILSVSTSRANKHKCYKDDKELTDAANRKLYLQSSYLPAVDAAVDPSAASPACPVDLYQQQQQPVEQRSRSISPWRYVKRNLDGHFPSSYTEAQCLCAGCILMEAQRPPVESYDYVSMPVKHSRLFMRKVPCGEGPGYRLTPVNVDVAVGCTCLRKRSRES